MSESFNILYVSTLIGVSLLALSFFNSHNSHPGSVLLTPSGDISYNPYREFNSWVNSLLLPAGVEESIANVLGSSELGYYAICYLRDLVAGCVVYWLTAGLWHLAIYHVWGNSLFHSKNRPLPTTPTLLDQMSLAQSSLFLYALLPIISEWLIEHNYTKVFFSLEEIGGLGGYLGYLVLYIACVEVGIYWMHRVLHTNKIMYKYIHGLHHKYNKATTLTPWASIAFNPIDGLLQASPYVFFMFLVPVHYFTHVFLLFFSGVWATNIHDAVPSKSEPIMGAAYHTIHHTHYHYNFGQFFIFCDYIWGSLRSPEQIAALDKQRKD